MSMCLRDMPIQFPRFQVGREGHSGKCEDHLQGQSSLVGRPLEVPASWEQKCLGLPTLSLSFCPPCLLLRAQKPALLFLMSIRRGVHGGGGLP